MSLYFGWLVLFVIKKEKTLPSYIHFFAYPLGGGKSFAIGQKIKKSQFEHEKMNGFRIMSMLRV